MKRWTLAAVLLVVAGIGYLAGSVYQPTARAHEGHGAEAGHTHGDGEAYVVMKSISEDMAHVVMDSAHKKAAELGTKMNIAIVDAGGNLKTFTRMDGAWLGSIDIAIKKARTARFFDMPTGDVGKLSQPGGSLYNIEHSNEGLITFPGGLPLRNSEGEVIGAIGVSGSTVESDHTVARAGVAALLADE